MFRRNIVPPSSRLNTIPRRMSAWSRRRTKALLGLPVDPEHRGSMFLCNIGELLPDCSVLQPRRQHPSLRSWCYHSYLSDTCLRFSPIYCRPWRLVEQQNSIVLFLSKWNSPFGLRHFLPSSISTTKSLHSLGITRRVAWGDANLHAISPNVTEEHIAQSSGQKTHC
jgi:hypothetical protein